MSDEIILQEREGPGGDPLSQEVLAKRRARSNSTHYVERGLGLTPDYANDDVEIGSGHALIRDERDGVPKAYDVFPNGRTGSDAISLADGEVNELYLVIDPDVNDDVWYDARTDGTTPDKPSLHIGAVDLEADSMSAASRRPDVTIGNADAKSLDVEKAGIGPNGERTIQFDSELDSLVVLE